LNWTLRELFWRKEALAMEQWNHTAWICFHIPSFSKEAKSADDFHPLKRQQWVAIPAEDFGESVREVRRTLPMVLSPEEKERKWREYCAKRGE